MRNAAVIVLGLLAGTCEVPSSATAPPTGRIDEQPVEDPMARRAFVCTPGARFELTTIDEEAPYAMTAGALVVQKANQLVLSGRDASGEQAFRLRLADGAHRTSSRGLAPWGLGHAALSLAEGGGGELVLVRASGERAGAIAFSADARVDDAALAVTEEHAYVVHRSGEQLRLTVFDLSQLAVTRQSVLGPVPEEVTLDIATRGEDGLAVAAARTSSTEEPPALFRLADTEATVAVPGAVRAFGHDGAGVQIVFEAADRTGLWVTTGSEEPEAGGPRRITPTRAHPEHVRVAALPDGFLVGYREGGDLWLVRVEGAGQTEAVALGPCDGPFELAARPDGDGVSVMVTQRRDTVVELQLAACD